MGRRAKSPKGKAEAEGPPVRKSPSDDGSKIRDLEERLAEAIKLKTEALRRGAQSLEREKAKDRALTESLEQQTATAEILKVISRTQTDPQPVFDAIVRSASTLCRAPDVIILMLEEEGLRAVASIGPVAAAVRQSQLLDGVALPLTREYVSGRAFIDRRTVHVQDVSALPDEFPVGTALQRQYGGRGTTLSVPLLRDDTALGVITLVRDEVSPFSEQQVTLLETFARQAVIALENVRLFTELQEKNRAVIQAHEQVTEALERQTATADILRVIASSPTEYQPVFDTIVQTAGVVCGAVDVMLWTVDGDELVVRAHHGPLAAVIGGRQPVLGSVAGYAVRQARVVHIEDLTEADDFPVGRDFARRLGWRTTLSAPLLREGAAIGVILIRRSERRPFNDQQIALLQTFADQAVIAIENVRLFTELRASNRELTTALDKQTATSDILRVISRSQTDVQPVFDAILSSVARLLKSYSTALTRVVGDQLELATFTSTDPDADTFMRLHFPLSLQANDIHCQAIRGRVPLTIVDAHADPPQAQDANPYARVRGWRSAVVVPLLRHGEAIGGIGVSRREPGGFTDDEIALLQTFADQAVIAIENVRLLSELQASTADLTRSVHELRALGEVGQAISSTLDLDRVLTTVVSRAVELSRADGGSVYEYDEATQEFSLRASRDLPEAYVEQVRDTRPRKGEGAVGRVAHTREPVQVVDISDATAYESRVRNMLLQMGLRALLAVPLIAEDQLVGALIVMRRRPGAFAEEEVALLQTFATQSALAIQNARLFREIEEKSRQLEVASQHKSEFLANMSHELRTPLNAIIGFSEVLSERMVGDLNEKQEEYLNDIHASGQHLLSLINDILDLSKIEAGRMELELTDFDLSGAIDNALTLVRERAGRREITLGRAIDERVGTIRADERKVKQVLLNLLSNALKFTPEGGRIDVRAAASDSMAEVSVADTGVGIAPEDHEAVFEEFRQVGTVDKKVEGTGLGLALSRKFIELHGGRIWVKSELGHGSTFTFTLPVRREPSDRGGAPTLNS